jgi:molecular chaperone Hsp33
MTERKPNARVIRALTSDQAIRIVALDASPLWDGVRRGHPPLEAGACAALVEILAAALLLQARASFGERLQILMRGSGRARALVADAWPEGDIRGILDPSARVEGPWLSAPGTFQVMRSNASGAPYIGQLDLVEGPLQVQVEGYLQQSEQVQASCALWCDPATGEAGGLLVEPLPDCPPERLRRLIHALEGLEVVPLWEREPLFLVAWINQGPGATPLDDREVRYHCRCTEQSLLDTLAAFPRERVAELFRQGDPIEVHCDYCGHRYQLELARILDARREVPHGGA